MHLHLHNTSQWLGNAISKIPSTVKTIVGNVVSMAARVPRILKHGFKSFRTKPEGPHLPHFHRKEKETARAHSLAARWATPAPQPGSGRNLLASRTCCKPGRPTSIIEEEDDILTYPTATGPTVYWDDSPDTWSLSVANTLTIEVTSAPGATGVRRQSTKEKA